MKKLRKYGIYTFVVALFVGLFANPMLATGSSNDVSTQINMSGNLSVVYQSGASHDIIVGNVPISPQPEIHVRNTLIYDIDWSLPNDVKMLPGDTFSIKIPGDGVTFNFTPNSDNDDATNPEPTRYEELFMNGQVLGFWTIENRGDGAFIHFIAHENLQYLEDVNGSFGFTASVDDFNSTSDTVSFGFGDNEWADTEISNPGYIEPDAWVRPDGYTTPEVAGPWDPITKTGLFEGYLPNGNGKLEWDIRVGIDTYQQALNDYEFNDFPTNVIMEDTLEGDQYFMYDDINIWSFFIAPANENGDMSTSYRSVDIIQHLPEPTHQSEGQDTQEWRDSIINSDTFAYGISYDRQTFLCNIGTLGQNGLYVKENNKQFEDQLYAEKLSGTGKYAYSADEIKTMMLSLGYNGEYTLRSGETITIDNQINGGILAYNFRLHAEAKPGSQYSNTVNLLNTPDSATATNPVTVLEFEGEIEAIYKGKVRVIKIDTETETVLQGATFALEQQQVDGSYIPYVQNGVQVTGVTDENGEISFTGIDEGFYRLVEVESAEGYDKGSLKLYMQSIPIDGDLTAIDYTTEVDTIEIDFIKPNSKDYVLVATNEKIVEGEPVIPLPDIEEGGSVIEPGLPVIPLPDIGEGDVVEPGLPVIPLPDVDEGLVVNPSDPMIPLPDIGEGDVIEPGLPVIPLPDTEEGLVVEPTDDVKQPVIDDAESSLVGTPSIPQTGDPLTNTWGTVLFITGVFGLWLLAGIHNKKDAE